MELWKEIPGYVGYVASNLGRVKRLPKVVPCKNGHTRTMSEKVLSERTCAKGYSFVRVTVGGIVISPKIHRLVALAFISNPKGKGTVNHINGIKSDNRVSNLEWATHAENMRHAWDNSLCSGRPGRSNPNAKLTKGEVLWARDMHYMGAMQKDVANMLGVNRATIGRLAKNNFEQ